MNQAIALRLLPLVSLCLCVFGCSRADPHPEFFWAYAIRQHTHIRGIVSYDTPDVMALGIWEKEKSSETFYVYSWSMSGPQRNVSFKNETAAPWRDVSFVPGLDSFLIRAGASEYEKTIFCSPVDYGFQVTLDAGPVQLSDLDADGAPEVIEYERAAPQGQPHSPQERVLIWTWSGHEFRKVATTSVGERFQTSVIEAVRRNPTTAFGR